MIEIMRNVTGGSRQETVAIILAAGKGTRMKSDMPKVLHPICGSPMIEYVLNNLSGAGIRRIIVVVGHKGQQIEEHLGARVQVLYQERLLGTGDAVATTKKSLSTFDGNILVLYGDTPLLLNQTLRKLIRSHRSGGASCTLLTATFADPTGYGRIVRDKNGKIAKIVEEQDADTYEKTISEINAGTYCFRKRDLFEALGEIRPANAKKEYYLTDTIERLVRKGKSVGSVFVSDENEILGVNSRKDMVKAQCVIRNRILDHLMCNGVTIVDPATTYINQDVRIGQDTIVYPFTMIESDVEIGRGCEVGPFCRIRSGSRFGSNVRLGNFVEINRTSVGDNTRIKHHTYLGDTVVGRDVNIGAGTITANFNGRKKHRTIIGNGAFTGCDTILVAPVKLGEGSVTGAGCVVTRGNDVPPHTVVVGMPARVLRKSDGVHRGQG
jgi:bifunctional UDP-N-acetylglucosamine pyrophosphorylase/glucosamine-1-phosphate N-acetyltransferase